MDNSRTIKKQHNRKGFKLFGMYWNSRNIGKNYKPIPLTISEKIIEDYKVSFNFFDINTNYCRKIDLMELMNVNNEEEISNIIEEIEPCDTIFININYIPNNLNFIVKKFFRSRIEKIFSAIKNVYYDKEIILLVSETKTEEIL